MIPGTEVSEKLKGLHGFVLQSLEQKTVNTNVDDIMEERVHSSNLIIEPHPEEYLAEKTREVLQTLERKKQKLNIKQQQQKEEIYYAQETVKEMSRNLFKVNLTSGEYSLSW